MPSPHLSAFDHYEEPLLTRAQVRELVNALPLAISRGLHERLNAVLGAQAPGPYSDALGELEAYLTGLEDAGSLPFEHLIQLKAYAMIGWKAWRAGFAALMV
ncbi:hypothetical protein BK660_16040 [Pseudomonas brassicacearum]|uniref:Uncharacterized protein n=1 Tax=Pseudomonas brassicacearum TaxID=930166 RepID=A0A423I565_9PSED|nr:hypothetical protein [Pseudomonas brassicacearum]RON20563.1 hypothetical protein BK660_16040 [Pseudomonas brassicacearum]